MKSREDIKVYRETKRKLEESYNHINPYLKHQESLKTMCNKCERYCGDDHNYDECRNNACFNFYLAFEYMEWCNSTDLAEKVNIEFD
jgi:hypothetical protein